MIDIKQIAEQLIVELNVESDRMKLRAEGVALLYERIRQAAEQHQKSAGEATREEQASSPAVSDAGAKNP